MNFNVLIEELRDEITVVLKNKQIKMNEVEKQWVSYTFSNPNSENKLHDLEEKFASAKDSEVEKIGQEIKDVRENILKYELEKKEKERKIDAIFEETKFEILKLIKKKIIKIKKSIDLANEQFITYAKNISESNDSIIDLKSLSQSFKNFDKVVVALEVLNRYNGKIETQSFCNDLVKGLDPENEALIRNLYQIITFYLIDMRQEVTINEDEVEETPINLEEVKEEISKADDIISKTEEIIFEVTNTAEDEIKFEAMPVEENVVIVESSTKEETLQENKKVTTPEDDFLEMYHYLSKNDVTEDDVIDFIVMYDSLKNVDEKQQYLFEKIIKAYNAKVEFENSKSDVIDHYSINEITLELLGKPYKVIAGSKLVAKINEKRLEKNLKNAIDDTLDEETQKYYQDKTVRIINDISSNYVISGVSYYINVNKLSKMKLKLYENGNKMLSTRFERKLNRVSNKVAKIMNKELNKLIKNEILLDDCLYLILDQYLELLSICGKDKIYLYHSMFESFLLNNSTEEIYKVYSYAARMIIDYRREYNFIPYQLKKVRDGVVYNEIEEIIEYYDDINESLENPERGMYIKNQNIISKSQNKTFGRH